MKTRRSALRARQKRYLPRPFAQSDHACHSGPSVPTAAPLVYDVTLIQSADSNDIEPLAERPMRSGYVAFGRTNRPELTVAAMELEGMRPLRNIQSDVGSDSVGLSQRPLSNPDVGNQIHLG
jgi:hypothetical protein